MTKSVANLPAELDGTEVTRFNALRHGVLSRYTVLPWENGEEYATLVAALVAEHAPRGATEEHLLEEVAGVIWRKRRLRLAEAAQYRRGLSATVSPHRETTKAALVYANSPDQTEGVADALSCGRDLTEQHLAEVEADATMTSRALKLLDSKRSDAYEAALEALDADTRGWWGELLDREPDELDEDEAPTTADIGGLRLFLESKVMPWYANRRMELANRPLIREQAFGEAFDPYKLERLGRYEVHLDRKLERMLTMLLRLKDLRQGAVAD